MADEKKVSTAVSAYLRRIGSKGGQIGGAKKGWCKVRSPDHYKKMEIARKAAFAARKAAKIEAERIAASHVYVVGSYKLKAQKPIKTVEPVSAPPKPMEPTFAPPITFTFAAS